MVVGVVCEARRRAKDTERYAYSVARQVDRGCVIVAVSVAVVVSGVIEAILLERC